MSDLLNAVSTAVPAVALLTRGVSMEEQAERGYGHTLREICRQPEAWRAIGTRFTERPSGAGASPDGWVLTGSGSSHFIGVALAPTLQASLGINVRAAASGALLLTPEAYVTAGSAATIVSFGRSGQSPECIGVIDLMLERHPLCRHIFVTCNPEGRLARGYQQDDRVSSFVLGREVDDKSLVMTSSFTGMWLAGRLLGWSSDASGFTRQSSTLADIGRAVLLSRLEELARVAREPYDQAVYLGSGPRFGAALEAELKMLEMCGGRVRTRAETYLGLRHGPMAGIGGRTLIVAFISSDERRRAYELDLLTELQRKRLGLAFVVCGAALPDHTADECVLNVEYGEWAGVGDDDLVAIDVLVGQTLGFFRCLHERLKPDSPSETDVISRVVPPFPMHPI